MPDHVADVAVLDSGGATDPAAFIARSIGMRSASDRRCNRLR